MTTMSAEYIDENNTWSIAIQGNNHRPQIKLRECAVLGSYTLDQLNKSVHMVLSLYF